MAREKLWAGIHDFVMACRGDDGPMKGNLPARQAAVARIEQAVEAEVERMRGKSRDALIMLDAAWPDISQNEDGSAALLLDDVDNLIRALKMTLREEG